MPLSVVVQIAVSGALMGMVYALIAYGFQLTYATSKSLNFGQGELVMVSAFVSLTLLAGSSAPMITAVVNAASFESGVTPGGLHTLYGTNLAGGRTAHAPSTSPRRGGSPSSSNKKPTSLGLSAP